MKILAIDTASFPASAAIADGENIAGEYIIRNKKKHSQNIMPMVDRLLADIGADINDMDAFAVTVGPGSFTGLRIGIATARAFAQAANKPVVGVSTLEALAYNFAGSERIVVSMLDARRDEVFAAAYRAGETLMEPRVITVAEATKLFSGSGAVYTGDGASKHKDEILSADETAVIAAPHLGEVRAGALAALAVTKLENKEAASYNEITPVYLRKSQAEREYDNKEGVVLK